MRIIESLRRAKARRWQRRLLRDIRASPIRYDGGGTSLQDPIVITGAEDDVQGTVAVLGWLMSSFGTMGEDWTVVSMSNRRAGGRRIDHYVIELGRGGEEAVYFDVSESFGRFPLVSLESGS